MGFLLQVNISILTTFIGTAMASIEAHSASTDTFTSFSEPKFTVILLEF